MAYLCSEYPPGKGGGIGTFTRAMGRALVQAGVSVDVVGVYCKGQDVVEEDRGVRVWRLAGARAPLTRFVRNGWKLTRKLRELRDGAGLELVEGQENAFAALGPVQGVKKIIRMHGGHHFFAVTLGRRPAAWRGWQERRSFGQADALCAVSRHVAETTRELLGLGGRRIEILPNCVDTEMFRPREEVREQDGLIVFAGTVCEKKGIRQLVEAMPAILAACPGARLADIHRAAAEAIKRGLLDLGLITDSAGDQYKTWFTHGSGHFIGIDVHDVGDTQRPLEPGMAFTIEPGIYVRREALESLPADADHEAFAAAIRPAFEKYRDIGVRIEDTFLMTTSGLKCLSDCVPRSVREIEALMKARGRRVSLLPVLP